MKIEFNIPAKITVLPAFLLCFGAAAFAQTRSVPVPVSVNSLQSAEQLSGTAAGGSSLEGLSAGASSAFHGAGSSSQVQIFLPGYNYSPAPRENIVFTKPPAPANNKPPVPAMEAMADGMMGKVGYSRKDGGFTFGKTAGYVLTALTTATAGACIGWFLVGGAAAAIGLGLLGLAVGVGLAALFLGVLKGSFAARPRKDGFDARINF